MHYFVFHIIVRMNNSKQISKCLLILCLMLLCTFDIGAQNEMEEPDIKLRLDTVPSISSLSIQSFKIDPAIYGNIYKDNLKLHSQPVNIYDMPYSVNGNYPNYNRLALNTGVLAGAGVAALGVLQLLPEGATSWNKKKISEVPFFKRWSRNVRHGPVWDNDNFVFNYVLHPYGGAVYYMGARSQGFNLYYSFLYSAAVSTLLWEYGVEAFMEIPSTQDLIVTPLAGVLVGEGFYLLKRHIVSNDHELFGSRFIGNVVVYIIDPVNEVIGIFAGNPTRKKNSIPYSYLTCTPWINNSYNGTVYGFTARLSF